MRRKGRREECDTTAHVFNLPTLVTLLNLPHMNFVRSFCDIVLEFSSIVDSFCCHTKVLWGQLFHQKENKGSFLQLSSVIHCTFGLVTRSITRLAQEQEHLAG